MKNKKLIIFTGALLGLFILLGIKSSILERNSKIIKTISLNSEEINKNEEELFDIQLYLPNEKFNSLTSKIVKIKYRRDRNEIIQEVIKNISLEMKNNGQLKNDIVLLNIFFSGKDLYLNLRDIEEFHENSNKSLYIIYSITNSLSELGGVERVKFMLDSKEKDGVFKSYYKKNNDL